MLQPRPQESNRKGKLLRRSPLRKPTKQHRTQRPLQPQLRNRHLLPRSLKAPTQVLRQLQEHSPRTRTAPQQGQFTIRTQVLQIMRTQDTLPNLPQAPPRTQDTHYRHKQGVRLQHIQRTHHAQAHLSRQPRAQELNATSHQQDTRKSRNPAQLPRQHQPQLPSPLTHNHRPIQQEDTTRPAHRTSQLQPNQHRMHTQQTIRQPTPT